jgi:signal transduction histidine kinase
MTNLIDNAIKYTKQGDVVVNVTSEGDLVKISIKDSGIGIAPEKQKHIFDKFYRVPTGNLHDVKGYGLGLFYVKTMIEKHGGSVSVKSELGKGSTFTIRI